MAKKNQDQKTIIRKSKNRDNPYVMINKNYIDYEEKMSWKAKGILTYLLAKPDNWQIILSDLIKRSKDGRDSTLNGLNELIEFGYIERIRVRDELGRFSHIEYMVYEEPNLKLRNTSKKTVKPDKSGAQSTNGKSGYGKPGNGKSNSGKSDTTNKQYELNNDNTKQQQQKNVVVGNESKNKKQKNNHVSNNSTRTESKGIELKEQIFNATGEHVPDKFIQDLINQWDINYIKEKIELATLSNISDSVSGFLYKACENNWVRSGPRQNSQPSRTSYNSYETEESKERKKKFIESLYMG